MNRPKETDSNSDWMVYAYHLEDLLQSKELAATTANSRFTTALEVLHEYSHARMVEHKYEVNSFKQWVIQRLNSQEATA